MRARPKSHWISCKNEVGIDMAKRSKWFRLFARATQTRPEIIQGRSHDGYSKTMKTVDFTRARAPMLIRCLRKMQS